MMFTLTQTQMIEELNKAKELVLGALLNEKMITREDYETFISHYAVIVRPKSILGKIWDKIHGEPPENACSYAIVAHVDTYVDENTEGREDKSPVKLVPKALEIDDEE